MFRGHGPKVLFPLKRQYQVVINQTLPHTDAEGEVELTLVFSEEKVILNVRNSS